MADGEPAYRRPVHEVLIVDDDADVRVSTRQSAVARGCTVRVAGTIAQGLQLLEPAPDLVIVDVRLPDGSGIEVVERCAALSPIPIIVAISGHASAEEAFRLSQAGAHGYLAKPHSLDALWAEVDEIAESKPNISLLVAASVGHQPLRAMREDVRNVMLKQAFGLSHGSRRGTAKLLDVSRQAVQQALRDGAPLAGEEPKLKPSSEDGSGTAPFATGHERGGD